VWEVGVGGYSIKKTSENVMYKNHGHFFNMEVLYKESCARLVRTVPTCVEEFLFYLF
jgi:hypothetical protein